MSQSPTSALRVVAEAISAPQDFIPLLRIVSESGLYVPFDSPHPEQVDILEALTQYPEVYIVKPRQIGSSTIVRAWDFFYGYTCPDPANCLIVSHEGDSTHKMHSMNSGFLEGLTELDPGFGRPLKASNRKELILADTGFTWRCITAGGRGTAKGFSFQRGHFTEVGSWDKVCDARTTWASLRAAMHRGPHYQLIAESTGHGPGTLWEDLIYQAQRSPTAKVIFSKWSAHPKYRTPAPVDFEPDDTELRLLREHRLDNDQLFWRRLMVAEMGLTQFRHNYPLTLKDAFSADSGYYFDFDALSSMETLARSRKPLADRNGMRIYEKPVTGRRYVIGVDASSGIGQDYAAIQVLSDEYRQVAVFHSNRTKPEDLAEIAAGLGEAYNFALILTENMGKQGGVCLHRLREDLRYKNLWTDDDGNDWNTTQRSKLHAYSFARRNISSLAVELVDLATVQEAGFIQQADNGAIAAPKGKHDDLTDALVLAIWALRDIDKQTYWTTTREMILRNHLRRLPGHSFGNPLLRN